MPLTDDEKQRIREEELERLRARDEYRRLSSPLKVAVFWGVLMLAAVLLWGVMRTGQR